MKIFNGALWRRPDFMRLWTAQTLSEFGSRFARDGLPLTAVLVLGADPAQVGIMAGLATAPRVIVGLLAGGHIDRARRRPVMIVTDILRAAILASVPLAFVLHLLSIAQLYVVAALVGGSSVVFDIANQAYFPALVDVENLTEGNTKLSVTASLANVGGPALTGLMIQLLTAPLAVGVTCVSYLVSAGVLGRIETQEQRAVHRPDAWLRDFRDGFAIVAKDPIVGPILMMEVSASLFVPMFGALYPFIALKQLHMTPFMFGLTFALGGIGALVGAALRPLVIGRLGVGPGSLLAIFLAGAVSFAIPLTYAPPILATVVLCVAQFAGDGFTTVAGVTIHTLRQTRFGVRALGRVTAVFQVADGCAAILGAFGGGLLGQTLGPRAAMLIAAAGLTASTLWAVFSPLRSVRETPRPLALQA